MTDAHSPQAPPCAGCGRIARRLYRCEGCGGAFCRRCTGVWIAFGYARGLFWFGPRWCRVCEYP